MASMPNHSRLTRMIRLARTIDFSGARVRVWVRDRGSTISVVFGKPTGGSNAWAGYPPGGLRNGPIELGTEG